MKTTDTEAQSPEATGPSSWLRSSVTVTLPGWGVALGAVALLALLLVALD